MKLGIVGISGLVGENILTSLNMLNIEFDELHLFGSSTVDNIIMFRGNEYEIKLFNNDYLAYLDYCILAVDNTISKQIIDYHIKNCCSCIIIDNSSEYRMSHPLIIPEINPDDMAEYDKIIANPNCSTTMLAMLLKPLSFIKNSRIKKVFVSTYQAASGAGMKGLNELLIQNNEYGDTELTTTFWKKQYIFNVFSHNSPIDETTHLNSEEMKMIRETRKIMHSDKLTIVPTCIRVPTLRSHCLSINVEFDRDVTESEIMDELNMFKGIKILNDDKNNQFPEPVISSEKSDIYVGRIRPNNQIDFTDYSCWSFFLSGDQLLKGASYNSVQILSYMMKLKN